MDDQEEQDERADADSRDPSVREAFLLRVLLDIHDGTVKPLYRYMLDFPGDPAGVFEEYRDLLNQGAISETADTTLASGSDPAEHIANYRIIRELGRGGQGTVFLADDLRLGKKVALKVLNRDHWVSPAAAERFRREATIASRLEHPGICPVYNVGVHNGVSFIAMRYIDGEPLSHRIATTRERASPESTIVLVELDEVYTPVTEVAANEPARRDPPATPDDIDRVLLFIEQAARALHAAHESGVIHRDVKPRNIMVTKAGHPVILDFGLAQDVEGDLSTLTQSGELFGTPSYMSPEQLRPAPNKLDRRTDIWSLGVTLFECLSLKMPFDAPTRDGIYQAIQSQDPPDLRRLNRNVSRDLRIVVATALARDRGHRYQTAAALAEDLRRVRMREPIRAKPVSPIVRLLRWGQRNPALAAALAGLFGVLAAGLATSLYFLRAARAALNDYDRLGALPTLQRLTKEAESLWPAEPSMVKAMEHWIDQADALVKQLPELRTVLTTLQGSENVAPYTDADREADIDANTAQHEEELSIARQRRALLADAIRTAESRSVGQPAPISSSAPASRPIAQLDPGKIPGMRARMADLDAAIAGLDAKRHARRTWKFTGDAKGADQFRHDTLADIVRGLSTFAEEDPTHGVLANVRDRLTFANKVRHATIDSYQAKWQLAKAAIAAEPKYHRLEITEQLGLIPIGPDPQSGLWEFAHLRTTTPGVDPVPERGGDGRLIITEDTGILFVLLPGGTFRMGARRVDPNDKGMHSTDPNVDPEAAEGEAPIRDVRLEPFFLSKYEMTQGQWLRVVGHNPSINQPYKMLLGRVTDLRNPIEQVSWDECDVWMSRLSLLLPTEAQWEYAARGGTTTPRWTGATVEGLAAAANVADMSVIPPATNWAHETWNDGFAIDAPVGSFAPNAFGLHDVLGNVFEWCRDWWAGYEVLPRPGDGLRQPVDRRIRVGRGGCFASGAAWARSAARLGDTPDRKSDLVGVRPARSVFP